MKAPSKSIFRDRDKEAAFWEKNFKETWKKGKPVKIKFAKNLSESINVRLDPKTLNLVRIKAREKGLGPTQIVRMCVMQTIDSL